MSSLRLDGVMPLNALHLHLSGHGLIPSLVMRIPQNGMSCDKKMHLGPLRVSLLS